MPNLYKILPLTRRQIFDAVPGLTVTEELFANSHAQMFCIKNTRHQYVSLNNAFVERTRMPSRLAVLGKTAGQLFPPSLAAGYEQQDGVVLTSGRSFNDKLEMITNADGTPGWYLTQKVPVRQADDRIVAIVTVSADLRLPVADDPRLGPLATAIDRIQTDYGRSLSISDLAKVAGMSLSQFERRTRDVLQLSPRRFLTQTRIEAAARMLRTCDHSLRAVAQDCGFYDQAQFCRMFRSLTGLTPSHYKASMRGE